LNVPAIATVTGRRIIRSSSRATILAMNTDDVDEELRRSRRWTPREDRPGIRWKTFGDLAARRIVERTKEERPHPGGSPRHSLTSWG
jgi:hypothetical protein